MRKQALLDFIRPGIRCKLGIRLKLEIRLKLVKSDLN